MNQTRSSLEQIVGLQHERGGVELAVDAANPRARGSRENRFESDQFIFLASHELQAPLRTISGYCQLLAEKHAEQFDTESQLWLQNVVDGINQMRSLVNGLLAYSRIGCRGESRRPVSCELVLNQVLSRLKEEIQASTAIITRDPLPIVVVDVTELALVFQQLLDNAIKYCREVAPRIHVGAEMTGGDCTFHVRDNGTGIGPDDLERVFALLNRLATGAIQPGNGIGLAICKKIVVRHGGSIWVESRLGVGSTFFFSIPMNDTCDSLCDA